MVSKLQKYFNDLINLQRKLYSFKVSNVTGDDFMALADLRDAYITWLCSLKEEEDFNRYGSIFASNNTISDFGNNGGVVTIDRYLKVKEILEKEMNLRVEFFTRLETTPQNNSSSKNENKKVFHISYNINIGRFIFNDNDSDVVDLEGKQKDTADCLVGAGKEVKISWDEIHDSFKDLVADQDTPNATELDARKRSVRTAVTEINKHTEKYLKENKNLIDAKDNQYWLQYEVDKGR